MVAVVMRSQGLYRIPSEYRDATKQTEDRLSRLIRHSHSALHTCTLVTLRQVTVAMEMEIK